MLLDKNYEEVRKAEAEQISKKPKKVGQIKPKPGHTLFEIDLSQSVVRKAVLRSVDANFPLNGKVEEMTLNKAVVMQPHCLYVSALNATNAVRKAKKMIQKHINENKHEISKQQSSGETTTTNR